MHYRKLLVLLAPVFASLLVMVCTHEQNPYLDASRSSIVFAPPMPADSGRDTSSRFMMFTTFHPVINLAFREPMQNLRVHVDHNRLWHGTDSILTRQQILQSSACTLAVSFSDTGWQRIEASATLSNGDSTSRTAWLYSYSPLNQQNVTGAIGDIKILQTDQVGDTDVFYVWRIPTDTIVTPGYITTVRLTSSLAFSTCALFVESKNGSAVSPAQLFKVSLTDTTPPAVTVLHDSVSGRDVFTGILPFYFTVQASDNASGVAGAKVNGTAFDSATVVNVDTVRYRKLITSVGTNNRDSLQEVVSATDNAGNTAVDTFWIHYDSQLSVPVIKVAFPQADTVEVKNAGVSISGTVSNNDLFDTLHMTLSINGAMRADSLVITPADTSWAWNVQLASFTNPDTNRLVLSLDNQQVVASKQLMIIRDSLAVIVDKTPPVISEIQIDGTPLTGKVYYTTRAKVAITVSASDTGTGATGVEQVKVDTAVATSLGNGQYIDSIPLVHQLSGDSVVVTVTDSAGNSVRRTFTIYRNRLPEIGRVPPFRTVADLIPYTDSVRVSDPDGDPLAVSLMIYAPHHDTAIGVEANGGFTWTPGAVDTGAVRITVEVTDGYQSVDSTYTIDVQPPRILYVRGALEQSSDKQMLDTLAAMGYDTASVWFQNVADENLLDYNAVFLSSAVTDTSAAAVLKNASVPVLCASINSYHSLGMVSRSDTGHVQDSSIIAGACSTLAGITTNVRITASRSRIPYGYPSTSATVTAHVVPAGILPVGTTGTCAAAIFLYPAGARLADGVTVSPSRRAAYPACLPIGNIVNQVTYTANWWKYLRQTLAWVVTGLPAD